MSMNREIEEGKKTSERLPDLPTPPSQLTTPDPRAEIDQPSDPKVFGGLAPELRWMVWELVAFSSPRVIILDDSFPIKSRELGWINILELCKDSRRAALAVMKRVDWEDIDFRQDVFQIFKPDVLAQLDISVLRIVQRACRLIVSPAVFRTFHWLVENGSTCYPIFPLTAPYNSIDRDSRSLRRMQEINIVIDARDKGFRDIMQGKILQSNIPDTYAKLRQYSRGKNRRLHLRVQKYLNSENWQLDYAKRVLRDMKSAMERNVFPSRSRRTWPRLRSHHISPQTPSINIWYPGEAANFVVTKRGDMDNEGEFARDGQGRPWATFIFPTVKVEYPVGGEYEMKKLT